MKKAFWKRWNRKKTICLTAEKAGKIIGYLLAYTAAGEAEIARIAVVREQQRQGAARAMMKKLEEVCREKNIVRLLLDVRESNEPARAFYAASGFKEDGIRQRYYEDPQEDAVLMSRSL